jgi:methionyl-tRNA formyltransferase
VHNKCRGLAVWPGLWSTFQVLTADPTAAEGAAPLGAREEEWAAVEAQRIKIITTAVLEDAPGAAAPTQTVTAAKQGRADVLRVVCGDGSVLGVLELQPPGKKVMAARDFLNGLRGRYAMRWTVPPLPPAQEPADAAKGA